LNKQGNDDRASFGAERVWKAYFTSPSLTQFVAFSQQVFILALAPGRGFKKGVAPSAREARSDCQK